MNATPILRTRKSLLTVALLVAVAIAPYSNAGAQDTLTADAARDLSREAWVFGLPLVMFEKQIDYSTM